MELQLKRKWFFDEQNESYPIPRQRNMGGFMVEEIRMLKYPPFVDIRSSGMNKKAGILSGIPQVTLNWSSPIVIEERDRNITKLLSSSKKSWAMEPTTVLPNLDLYPEYGFEVKEARKPHTLALAIEGSFESYFKGKESPLLSKEENKEDRDNKKTEENPLTSGVIEKSPTTSRIILFASNEFLVDATFGLSQVAGGSSYLNSLQLIENSIDWSLEDRDLLQIRGGGNFSRTLKPITKKSKRAWEFFNYIIGGLLILLIYLYSRFSSRVRRENYAKLLKE